MSDQKQIEPKRSQPLLIYDGDCSFCRMWVDYGRSATGRAVAYEPYQKAAARFPEIRVEQFRAAAQFVDTDGRVSSAAEAIFRTLSYAPEKRWLLWSYRHVPLFAALTEAAYRWIARHRSGLYRLTRVLWGRHVEPARFVATRAIFLRVLGLIYLIAFASWWWQIPGLIGSEGIIPAPEVLREYHERFGARAYALVPSLAWLHPTDAFIRAMAAAGIIISLLVVADFLAGPALLALWLLYASQVSLGRDFMAFQWDSLLLEAGFIAIWLAPWPRLGARRVPAPALIWVLRLLLFRVMFSSGMVKLLSGDPTWHNLTALTYHYETQPLPNVISWYMQQLPRWFQTASVVFVFAIELGVPFLIFLSRRFRRVAAALIALFQVLILLTGNYAFFNLLTLALCVPLLDDGYLRPLLPRRLRIRAMAASEHRGSPLWRRIALAIVTIVLIWAGTFLMMLRFQWYFPSEGSGIAEAMENLHLAGAYGLFAVMTTERNEIVIEGSDDGETWKPYEFRYKPGPLSRKPPWVAPYQPRLDWQMWFAALGSYRQTPWFVNFMVRLMQGSPGVLRLMGHNPFPDHPPRSIRAVLYQYHFTSWAERRATGNWWKREELGLYLPPRLAALRSPCIPLGTGLEGASAVLKSGLVTIATADGRQAELGENHWNEHIIKRHPELMPYRDLVIEALRSPDGIYRSKRDPATRIYVKNYQGIRIGEVLQERSPLRVVVHEDGFVATAYFVGAAWRGLGEQIWPS